MSPEKIGMKRTKPNNTKSTLPSSSTSPLGAAGDHADEVDVAPLAGDEAFNTAYRDVAPNPAVTIPVESRPDTESTPNQPGNSNITAEQDQQNVDSVNVPAKAPNEEPAIHPVAALFPMLPEVGLAELAEDIRINGLAHAIVMHDGQIVDGRNRLLACRRVGVQPRFVEWREIYTGTLELPEWIWSQNAHRRHMTPVQLAAGYLVLFGDKDRQQASLGQAEGRRLGGHTAGRSRRKVDSSLSNSTASYLPDTVAEDADLDKPAPNRATAAHSTGRRQKLATHFNISRHAAKQLLQVEAARPELLRDIVQGSLTLAKAAKLACPSEEPEVPGAVDPDLEPVIRKAVRAVEKLLARVPEHQQDNFKAAVAETVRNLA